MDCDAMNVINKLNEEFSELQDENIKLKEENKRLKFNVCIQEFMDDIQEIMTNLYSHDVCEDLIVLDEQHYLLNTNDTTTTILKKLYNWEEQTCDCWYRTDKRFPCVSWKTMFPWKNQI